jgi:hypothetical protein
MKLRVITVDLAGVEQQLARIADALEGLLKASDPLPPDLEVEDDPNKTVFYSDETEDLIRERMARLKH